MAEIESPETIADELEALALLLNDEGFCDNVSPLTDAAYFCRNYSNSNFWHCQLNRLVFNLIDCPLEIPKDKRPLDNFKLIFTLNIKGKYIQNFNVVGNPLNLLQFDVDLECNDSNNNVYFSSWHLDKHLVEAGDGPVGYHHPEYHIAFGGNNMIDKSADYGSLYLLSSPRICHPPMDAVLGVDFILRNFFHRTLNIGLFSNTSYRELVKNAQFRFWRPFSLSFASRWFSVDGISLGNDFSYDKTFPELF